MDGNGDGEEREHPAQHHPGPVGHRHEIYEIDILPFGGEPEGSELVTQGGEAAVQAHLRHHRHDQPRNHGPQVAGGGEHQKPPRAAAREHHADAEKEPADDRARPCAGHGHDARILGAHQPHLFGQLHPEERRGEGKKPYRHRRPHPAAGEFDRRRAQAEA